jgi:hypothetical protein
MSGDLLKQIQYLASEDFDTFKHQDGSTKTQAEILKELDLLEAATISQRARGLKVPKSSVK